MNKENIRYIILKRSHTNFHMFDIKHKTNNTQTKINIKNINSKKGATAKTHMCFVSNTKIEFHKSKT